MKLFSLCNQKGGVGKTTTAVNVSAVLAMQKRKVLLVDIDPQGNATSGIGIDKTSSVRTTYDILTGHCSAGEAILKTSVEGVDLIPSNPGLAGGEIELIHADRREFILRAALEKISTKYDFIFMDCPPSLGLLTVNALVAAHGLLIPLQCEYYALEGLGQLINTFNLVKENLNPELEIAGVIMTMADFRTNLTNQVIDDVRSHFGGRVFETVITRSVKVSEAPSFGKPVVLYDPSSKGAKKYQEAGEEFLKRFLPKEKSEETQPKQEGVSEATTEKESVSS